MGKGKIITIETIEIQRL